MKHEAEQAVLALLRGEAGVASDLADARRQFFARRVPAIEGRAVGPVRGRVEIVTDRWGIPHIFAGNTWDLFVAFGFAVARERLWQLDYRRRAASGRLAEILGREALSRDVEARTLDFRGIATQEWERTRGEAREALEAYAAGVNLARAQCLEQETLPVEFALLEYEPEPWEPLDSLTIARASVWQFSGRIEGIVLAEAALRCLPPHLADLFFTVEAAEQSIASHDVASQDGGSSARRRGGHGEGTSQIAQVEAAPPDSVPGSNQFTAGPALTRAGKPVLASDGHVPYTQPSSLFEIHLCGAGYDAIGIAQPGIPMLGNGRNRRVAWGSTNNVSSCRDLYLETPHPEDSDRYRDGNDWRAYETRSETICVRGEAEHQLVVRSTVRGPVVNHLISSVDPAGDPPLSLRWVGFEPEDTFGLTLDLIRAESADAYRAIHARYALAASNPGFADVDGHIGYQMRGRVPLRGRATRGYRRAGEPADEWRGFIPFEQLPADRDPARGWTGSANNRPAPDGHPAPLYGAYADGYRMRRIRHLLDGAADLTAEDLGRMQFDTFSGRAAELCPTLMALLETTTDGLATEATERGRQEGGRKQEHPSAALSVPSVSSVANPSEIRRLLSPALQALREWDYRFEVDRVGASVFQAFWQAWTRRVAAVRFPAHLVGSAAGGCAHAAYCILRDGDGAGGGEPWFPAQQARSEIVRAFEESVAWLSERLGSDPGQWTWGALHPVTFRHALAGRFPACTELNVGPFPCCGSTSVLNQNGFATGERLEVTSGPHYRFLADLASPDTALGTHTTGNSGHPGSPHYADQAGDWLAGRTHPLLMDRGDVQSNAVGRLVLDPSEPSDR
jgi:penicillin amidase